MPHSPINEETEPAASPQQAVDDSGQESARPDPTAQAATLDRTDLLVEDISIDGMCGVY